MVKKYVGRLKTKWNEHTRLYYDNKFTIIIIHNPMQHNKTEHVKTNRHFIRKKKKKN